MFPTSDDNCCFLSVVKVKTTSMCRFSFSKVGSEGHLQEGHIAEKALVYLQSHLPDPRIV